MYGTESGQAKYSSFSQNIRKPKAPCEVDGSEQTKGSASSKFTTMRHIEGHHFRWI